MSNKDAVLSSLCHLKIVSISKDSKVNRELFKQSTKVTWIRSF